jgi:broad specificity phosphatase PhoE
MLRILLVRHGQTDWNAVGRNQGSADVELDSVGIKQSEQLALCLESENIEWIYSSDLKRAAQTAERVAAKIGSQIVRDPLLRERSYGTWEGLTTDEIEAIDLEHLEAYRRDPALVAPPEGETGIDLFARAGCFLVKLLETHPRGTALIVSHGGTIANLIAALLHGTPSTAACIRIFNCAITEIVILENQRRIVVRFNDIAHLNPKPLDHTFAGSAAH